MDKNLAKYIFVHCCEWCTWVHTVMLDTRLITLQIASFKHGKRHVNCANKQLFYGLKTFTTYCLNTSRYFYVVGVILTTLYRPLN